MITLKYNYVHTCKRTHTHMHTYIYGIYVCVRVCVCGCVFFLFIYFVLTSMLYMCMLSACCFPQRTCMAQCLVYWVLNETWTHSCLKFECFSVGYDFYIEVILSLFTFVCFTPLWYLMYFSTCVCVCVVCMCMCVCWNGFGFHSLLSFYEVFNVCLGDFFVYVWLCGFKFTGNFFYW